MATRTQPPRAARQRQANFVNRAYIRTHLRDTNNHDQNGNAWCHLDGCKGMYTAYRVNIWGLQGTQLNQQSGKDKVAQQAVNLENHLLKAHGIPSHRIIRDHLPKGTPPFPEVKQVADLKKEKEALQSKLADNMKEKANLKREITKLRLENADLDADVETLKEWSEALHKRVKILDRDFENLFDDIRDKVNLFTIGTDHTDNCDRLTYLLRRKLAIRESQVIKWAWEHLDEEGIYFGPEIETEEESDDSCTREEPGPSRKASGHPSPSPASHRKGKRKASGHPSPSPASHRKGKRKASGHPTLQQPSAKRARTSTEEESDYFLNSPPTPPFKDYEIVKGARMRLPRGSYSGGHQSSSHLLGQSQPPLQGFRPPVRPPTGGLVAAINRLSQRK